MNATLSRSDVLKPLAWLIGMLALGLVLLAFAKATDFVLMTVLVLLSVSVILYGVAYGILLFIDRDALRSEKYSLHKMAIEHNLLGDSSSGIFEAEELVATSSEPAIKIEKAP